MSAARGPAQAPGKGAPLLDDEQLQRYSRQILLEQVGVEGQRRLLEARVLVVGAGGLGSPALIYLAAAGVGTLGVVDGDAVDVSNLHRQVLHFTHDVGRPKVQSARRHIEDLNPDVRVTEHPQMLTAANALDIVRGYDLVVNGCDNFPTRYLINDACVLLGKPLVDASILQFEGRATVFLPGRGCYRCLHPNPPPPGSVPSCAEGGIIGALAGHMGTLQALEAVKVLLGAGDPLSGRLVLFDALAGTYRTLRWKRNPDCPVCGDRPTITGLVDYEAFCGLPRSAPAAAAGAGFAAAPTAARGRPAGVSLTVQELARSGATEVGAADAWALLQAGEVRVVDIREPAEFAAGHLPGAERVTLDSPHGLAAIDPDRPTLLVCQIGVRSGYFTHVLRRAGYDQVYNLQGGLAAWENLQLPIERG